MFNPKDYDGCECEVGRVPDGVILCGKQVVHYVRCECDKCSGRLVPICLSCWERIQETIEAKKL